MSPEEQIGTYAREGTFLTSGNRSDVLRHQKAGFIEEGSCPYAVKTVSALLVTSQSYVHLALRSPTKKDNRELWDKTVGAHVVYGETHDMAIARETREEVQRVVHVMPMHAYPAKVQSVDLSEEVVMRPIDHLLWYGSHRREPEGTTWVKRENLAVYAGIFDGMLEPDDDEVADTWLVPLEELLERVDVEPKRFTPDLIDHLRRYQHWLRNPLNIE